MGNSSISLSKAAAPQKIQNRKGKNKNRKLKRKIKANITAMNALWDSFFSSVHKMVQIFLRNFFPDIAFVNCPHISYFSWTKNLI